MKCDYINLFFHDYIDGYLSVEQSHIIEKHVENCGSCYQTIAQIRGQKNELAGLESAGLSTDFTDAVINHVEIHFSKDKSSSSKKLLYAAIAASFLLASFITFTFQKNQAESIIFKQAVVAVNQQKINMVFNSPNALQNVRFTVILPSNVEMAGHPGKRQVVWFGDLSAGPNLLSIPVISKSMLPGILFTKLEYENNSRVFEVKMINSSNKRT